MNQFPQALKLSQGAPGPGRRPHRRAPWGRWCQPGCRRHRAPGSNPLGLPLRPTRRPGGVSPTRLGSPKGKSCTDRGARRAQTAARSARGARARGSRAGVGGWRVSLAPARRRPPGLHRCLRFGKLPGHGFSFPGEVLPEPPASGHRVGWNLSTSRPQSPDQKDDCPRARAREGSQEKENSGGIRLQSVLPFSQSSQTFSSTLGRQECPNLPALLRGSHYKALGCRPFPGPEGQAPV